MADLVLFSKQSEMLVEKRQFFILPFRLTSTITSNPWNLFHKILTQTAQVPKLLCKILPKSLTFWVGRNNNVPDKQLTDGFAAR